MTNPIKKDGSDPMDNNQQEHSDTIDQAIVQERLGVGLRSMYRSVLEEPLPDDMMALLNQLDDSDDEANSSE